MPNYTKVIDILDYQAQKIKETELVPTRFDSQDVQESVTDFLAHKVGRRMPLWMLREVATTSQFPSLLRDGLRPIMYDSYAGVPATWQEWCADMSSDKQFEDWIEGSHIGLLPIVPEGRDYPDVDLALDRTVQIRNDKRGGLIQITEEMIKFDKLNIIIQQAQDLGAALAMTHEQDAYNVLTTTTNYVRNSTTSDNEVGANTGTVTFGPAGLTTAISTLVTMKDRKSGRYLGVMPDTLIIGPRLEFFAKQLLLSDLVSRAHGATTAEIYGQGTTNPWRGVISKIVVSPFMAAPSQSWALMQAKKAVQNQQVEGLQLLQTSMDAGSYTYVKNDTIYYRGREWYGIGMLNDRFAYYSDSTTAPVVD